MEKAEKEFNKAMNALLLELPESIVKDVRQKCESYAREVAVKFASHFWIESMKAVFKMREANISNEELFNEWITNKDN